MPRKETSCPSIEQAEYVPHPKYDGEYALLLHENYHLLSQGRHFEQESEE
ncbi:MAG: transcriptional regulator SplA domain-containing protein [Bacillus licheniformis]